MNSKILKTANYSNTNHNFVFQNIRLSDKKPEYYPAICILKNILQRGKPTRLSNFLESKFGKIYENKNYKNFIPLISNNPPNWNHLIRGDIHNNNFPAKDFFENLIPKYFPEYPFLNQLIAPEVPINFITQVENKEFNEKQVDFFLPQAFLVIEIDGFGHDKNADLIRDNYLKRFRIETVRFSTIEIKSENESFKSKIEKIRLLINNYSKQLEDSINPNRSEYIPSIFDYKKAFEEQIYFRDNDFLKVTAILRLQLLCLELLENSLLKIDKETNLWHFKIKTDTHFDFIEQAFEDLKLWLINILRLHKVNFGDINFNFEIVNTFSNEITDNSLKIDFSLFKRFTDENIYNPDIIYIRNDYFDFYQQFEVINIHKIKYIDFAAIDYYKISTTKPINYNFNFDESERCDKKSLIFFLENIFGYKSFRDGQLQIIVNCLRGNSTIGLLPTGGGKSICFQLPVFLQPGISFVVCPIKSLMFDQKIDLNELQITRVEHLTSNDDSFNKELILKKFNEGKYQFLFISPERFQQHKFRDYLLSIQKNYLFTYAVIDEVHCLSEWGHDFRVSYLNLTKTINKVCENSIRYIALTATASIKVLEDIKIELKIKNENVITLTDYSRPELEFNILSANNNKYAELTKLLNELNNDFAFINKKQKDHAGIIFTLNVNGKNGCKYLSEYLKKGFPIDLGYFSGSKPKKFDGSNEEFEEYKLEVQNKFKINEIALLFATKAFGMGVNKKNISFTIHYGIPGSMESLYQEAGRAGRDRERYLKEKAKSFVLFEENSNIFNLDLLWDSKTTISELKSISNFINGDLNSNLYLMLNSLDGIEIEFRLIKNLIKLIFQNENIVEVNSKELDYSFINEPLYLIDEKSKTRTEKAIYRLVQLGLIEDWEVKDFQKGIFTIYRKNYNLDNVKRFLKSTIEKYESNSIKDELISEDFLNKCDSFFEDKSIFEKTEFEYVILKLLDWVYDHFVYNRRQSLKNVYQVCQDFIHSKENEETKKEKLRLSLESYFKFNESSFILQHISENAFDFKKWFEVFHKTDNTEEIINLSEIASLQSNLSRFLESYANNVGLNFISGIVRLLANDFENSDGRKRLYTSFKIIFEAIHFDKSDIDYIIKNSSLIIKNFEMEYRNIYAEFLIKSFNPKFELILEMNNFLEDEYSVVYLLGKANNKIKELNIKIHEQFEKLI